MAKIVLRFQDRIESVQQQSEVVDQLRKILDALSQKLQAELSFWQTGSTLQDIPDIPELKSILRHALGDLNQKPVITPVQQRRYKSGKTNVQRYAEILAEYGPMHVTDLLEKAREKGIVFKGKGKRRPTVLITDALSKSKRGFINFGGNYWGLAGQQPPTFPNGHKTEQPQLTQF